MGEGTSKPTHVYISLEKDTQGRKERTWLLVRGKGWQKGCRLTVQTFDFWKHVGILLSQTFSQSGSPPPHLERGRSICCFSLPTPLPRPPLPGPCPALSRQTALSQPRPHCLDWTEPALTRPCQQSQGSRWASSGASQLEPHLALVLGQLGKGGLFLSSACTRRTSTGPLTEHAPTACHNP